MNKWENPNHNPQKTVGKITLNFPPENPEKIQI
jgi:hypothetical protein